MRTWRPTLEHVVLAAIVAVGVASTAGPIDGNTMFVHLRTGIDMFRDHAIPRRDPYSFTAAGEPWVAQSWLAEWTYGALHRLGGFRAVVLEQMALTGAIGVVLAALVRTGRMAATAVSGVAVVGLALPEWSARPQLFGVLCFAVAVLLVERGRRLWLLVPVVWLWVNTHGSFPLLVVWLVAGAVAGGSRHGAGWRSWRPEPIATRAIGWCAAGLVAAMANPLGPRLLAFPLRAAGARHTIFTAIDEWSSPDFRDPTGVVLLGALLVSAVVVVRGGTSWRRGAGALVLVGAGLYAVRNLPFAAVALAPVLREAWRRRPLAPGGPASSSERRTASIGMIVIVVAVVLMVVRVEVGDGIDFRRYPVAASRWMDGEGLLDAPHRVAAPDVVGCYRILRDGTRRKVFVDDRYDMYPVDVAEDSIHLLRLDEDPGAILDRYAIDVVLVRHRAALAQWLRDRSGWAVAYADGDWVVYRRA